MSLFVIESQQQDIAAAAAAWGACSTRNVTERVWRAWQRGSLSGRGSKYDRQSSRFVHSSAVVVVGSNAFFPSAKNRVSGRQKGIVLILTQRLANEELKGLVGDIRAAGFRIQHAPSTAFEVIAYCFVVEHGRIFRALPPHLNVRLRRCCGSFVVVTAVATNSG